MHSLCPKAIEFGKLSGTILEAVHKLLDPNPPLTRRQWQYLFQDIYALCAAASGQHIPTFRTAFTQMLDAHVAKLSAELAKAQRTELLRVYHRVFDKFHTGLLHANEAFTYFHKAERDVPYSTNLGNRGVSETGVTTILAVGMELWRAHIFEHLKEQLHSELSTVVEKDRNGELADINTAQAVLESYIKLVVMPDVPNPDPVVQLRVYVDEFEKVFLEQTRDFYRRETNHMVQTLSCTEYLEKAHQRLDEEALRAKKLLHRSSDEKLRELCEKCVIIDHRDMIERHCKGFIEERNVPSLKLTYSLLQRIRMGHEEIRAILEDHITAQGNKRVGMLNPKMSPTLPSQYVDTMTELYTTFQTLIRKAFFEDMHFVTSLDSACRNVVNSSNRGGGNSIDVPNVLAKFCDDCLRKSSKHLGDTDVDERLNVLINIFKYVDDKDVFQKMYSKLLAKRLIHNTSISDDAEEAMISKLKQCCGYEYTSKLQQMFTDIKLSTEINSKFRKTEVGGSMVGFKVLVLQSGAWPLGRGQGSSWTLACEQERCVKYFEKFYDSQHSGRKLTWLHHLSTADVTARISTSKYEFVVTAYQMGILLLYNCTDVHTVASLAATTNLSKRELNRSLRSLVTCKLLIPEPPLPATGDVPGECTLSLNLKYSNKKKKVKISSAVQKETPAETKRTYDSVLEDRKHFLQAAIVRVMKMRRVLVYNMLIKETIDLAAARFKPSIASIKRAIEDLIDKQFLERSEANKNELHYLA